MLKTSIATQEHYDAFLRPAIHDSIYAVLNFYGLMGATNIYYNGETDLVKLIGANATERPDLAYFTEGTFRNKIFITPEVERSEFWNNRREMTERPVFAAPEIPLIICPSFENKKITVKVVCMFNTYADANQFKIRINRQRENQIVDFNFTPTNHMVFNQSLLKFVQIVHAMLKKNVPETPDFEPWFKQYNQFAFHGISNVKGEQPQTVVPLRTNNVGITLTEPFVSKVNKGQTYGRFEVEFSYRFYLNDFIGWDLDYPLNIWQDEIPEEYIPPPQPQYLKDTDVAAGPEITSLREITPPKDFIQSPYYLKLPLHDPWACPYRFWIQAVVQARLALADLEEQPLGNMFELPEFAWKGKAKAYILRRHEVAFRHHHTPFLFQLYEGNRLVDPEALSMDETGLITLRGRPDLSKTYRLVACIDYAIRDYDQELWDDMGRDMDRWAILRAIFNWYDFKKVPDPWILNIDIIKRDIDRGWGSFSRPFNIWEMQLGLVALKRKGA